MDGEVASLYGSLGFKIDDKQLENFLSKLEVAKQKVTDFQDNAKNSISYKVGLDKEHFAALKASIASIGTDTKVSIANVNVADASITALRGQLSDKLSRYPVHLTNIQVGNTALKASLAEKLEELSLNIAPSITSTKLNAQLKDWWEKVKEKRFALEVDVNKEVLFENLRAAFEAANARTSAFSLKVRVDKTTLKEEVKAAVASIKTDVSVPVRVTGVSRGAPAIRSLGASEGGLIGGAIAGGTAAAMSGVSLVGAAYGVGKLSSINQELQGIQTGMEAVTGSSAKAAEQLKLLSDLGDETGKTLRAMGTDYISLYASIQNEDIKTKLPDIFAQFTKYGTVMGLSEDAMKGTYRGISQMFNKQQAYAEELIGQVGERLPAAIKIASEVMTGGDTKALLQMMKEGKLKPEELVPKMSDWIKNFIGSSDAYVKSLEKSRVSQGRFNKSFEDFVGKFGEAGLDREMANFFNNAKNAMTSFTTHAAGTSEVFKGIMVGPNSIIRVIEQTFSGKNGVTGVVDEATKKFGVSMADMGTVGSIALVSRLPLVGPWIAGLLALGIAVDDYTTHLNGGVSRGDEFYKSIEETLVKVKELTESFAPPYAFQGFYTTLASTLDGIANSLNKESDSWLISQLKSGSQYAKEMADYLSSVNKAAEKPLDGEELRKSIDAQAEKGASKMLEGSAAASQALGGGMFRNPGVILSTSETTGGGLLNRLFGSGKSDALTREDKNLEWLDAHKLSWLDRLADGQNQYKMSNYERLTRTERGIVHDKEGGIASAEIKFGDVIVNVGNVTREALRNSDFPEFIRSEVLKAVESNPNTTKLNINTPPVDGN